MRAARPGSGRWWRLGARIVMTVMVEAMVAGDTPGSVDRGAFEEYYSAQ